MDVIACFPCLCFCPNGPYSFSISESQDKYITISHSHIISCQSQLYWCDTTVKQQMCTRKNISSKYQQVLVHPSSARILCTVPCTVLLIHVQAGCSQTGGGAEWRWETGKTASERRLIAWLKQGQCLIPECMKTQHWTVLLFQSAPSSPSWGSAPMTNVLLCLLQVLLSNCLQWVHVGGRGGSYSDVHQMLETGLNSTPRSVACKCLK